MKESRTFPNHPESVIKARRFVAAATARMPVDVRDVVELMVSELATNAVRHTDSGFAVDVEVTPELIRIEVTDRGAGEPLKRSPAPLDPSGRGLRIVETLANDWGVIPADPNGKTVWFTTALPRSATG